VVVESANRESVEAQNQAPAQVEAAPQQAVTAATAAVQCMLGRGEARPSAVAQVIKTYPGQRDAVMLVLQQTLGNGFVQEVLSALHATPQTVGAATAGGAAEAGDKPPPPTEKLAGTLWAKGPGGEDLPPTLEDISQGGLNDCFVFAAMASLASTDPSRIKNMIKDNGNGSYTVTFKGIGFFSADEETVTADFVVGKHGNVAARHALWPLIIEAAYAKQKGGIDELDTGGNSGDAVDDFTNDSAGTFDPHDETVEYIAGKLGKAHDKKWPTTMLTPKSEDATDAKKKMGGDYNLHFWHGYTVIDFDAAGKRVKLFNPWGHDHPGKSNDGWLPLDVIHDVFTEVDINS
jgi:hypothetical protein